MSNKKEASSEKVLAIAAGHEITEAELNQLIANYPPEQQIYLSNPKAKDEVLEQLISFHLFAKMADEEKIRETEAYQSMIAKMQVELASHMAATSVVEHITVSPEEEKAFYEENRAQFVQGPKVSAKHILVDTQELAKKAAEEIAAGKAFEDAAKEYSTCPSKDRGGELGYFTTGQMVPEFEKAAFEAEIGKVVGPIQTQFGYHLILVGDKKEGTELSFDQVQDQIHNQLIQSRQQKAYNEKVKELAEKYGVEKKI